ncbi:MAG: acyltransferase [Lentisphaerae bacterium]|nr:acyltransferase [Lentisphaerota bacterium]
MRTLFFLLFKLSSKLQRFKAKVRGYYFSKIFKRCGSPVPRINRDVIFVSPQNIECGAGVRINPRCYFIARGGISLGDNVIISACAQILSSSLLVENGLVQRKHVHKPVKIGSRTWIGAGAIICPGVTIGENSIIGAGAVVTKDIPANSLAAGVPARVIRSFGSEK